MTRVCDTLIFKKFTNLLPYYMAKVECGQFRPSDSLKSLYTQDRWVSLVLIFGVTEDGKPVAKIKCPISPMPIVGEFHYSTKHGLIEFLEGMGWENCNSFDKKAMRLCAAEYVRADRLNRE